MRDSLAGFRKRTKCRLPKTLQTCSLRHMELTLTPPFLPSFLSFLSLPEREREREYARPDVSPRRRRAGVEAVLPPARPEAFLFFLLLAPFSRSSAVEQPSPALFCSYLPLQGFDVPRARQVPQQQQQQQQQHCSRPLSRLRSTASLLVVFAVGDDEPRNSLSGSRLGAAPAPSRKGRPRLLLWRQQQQRRQRRRRW